MFLFNILICHLAVVDTFSSAKDTSIGAATGAKDYVKDTLVGAKDSTVDAAGKARDKLEQARSSIAEKGHGVSSITSNYLNDELKIVLVLDAKEYIKETATGAKDTVEESAKGAKDSLKESAEGAKDYAREKGSNVADRSHGKK